MSLMHLKFAGTDKEGVEYQLYRCRNCGNRVLKKETQKKPLECKFCVDRSKVVNANGVI